MLQEHRKSVILTKLARDLDPTVPPAQVSSQPGLFSQAKNWLSQQFGSQNPAVADYNKAMTTPTPFDSYIKQYKASPEAKMPGISAAGSPTSGTIADLRDTSSWLQKQYRQRENRDNAYLNEISNRYDAEGRPLSGMRSTTPELIQKAYARYDKAMEEYNRPLGSQSLPMLSQVMRNPMSAPIRSRAEPVEPFVGQSFYKDDSGAVRAVSPPSLPQIGRQLEERANERKTAVDTAYDQSADVLNRRIAGEMNPFVQAGPMGRAVIKGLAASGIAGYMASREGEAAKARATRDTVLDYTKRNLGYSPQEVAADSALREAKRGAGAGYWLDNLADTLRGSPPAAARLLNNPFEGAGRFVREQAARNRAARMGEGNRDDRLNTLEAIRNQERDRAEGERKKELLGGATNPFTMLPIPGVEPPEDILAGLMPTGRLSGPARFAVQGIAPLLGSRVGLGAQVAQGLTPAIGQTAQQYVRGNLAPQAALGSLISGLAGPGSPETMRQQADNAYTDRSQQVLRALGRLRASQGSGQPTPGQ